MPIAVITLAESGRFAIAQYPEGVAVSPHCVYLPTAIHRRLGKELPLPRYLKSVRVKSSQQATGLAFVIATDKEAPSF